MKTTCPLLILTLALAAGGVRAQSGNPVPGPADFSNFARFITDRNIFDPNRVPHGGYTRPPRRPIRNYSDPTITLVGVMAYEKGWFAFFSGNDANLQRVLYPSQTIAGYTVTDITPRLVTLVSTNETLNLRLGDSLRQEGGRWRLVGASQLALEAAAAVTNAVNAVGTNAVAVPASSAVIDGNDTLKQMAARRLLEQQNK